MSGPAGEVRAEADRIAAVLMRAAAEIDKLRASCPPEERMRWRRAQQILATAATEVGVPGLFDPPERVKQVGQ